MSNAQSSTDTQLRPSHDDGDPYAHIVIFGQWVLNDVLRIKVPRALCGVLLVSDPDRPEPGADAPVCPRCQELS
jgi:hypothetical protein